MLSRKDLSFCLRGTPPRGSAARRVGRFNTAAYLIHKDAFVCLSVCRFVRVYVCPGFTLTFLHAPALNFTDNLFPTTQEGISHAFQPTLPVLISAITLKLNSSDASALPISTVPAASLYHASVSLQWQRVSIARWLTCRARKLSVEWSNLAFPIPFFIFLNLFFLNFSTLAKPGTFY